MVIVCPGCGGRGRRVVEVQSFTDSEPVLMDAGGCAVCGGSGDVETFRCVGCDRDRPVGFPCSECSLAAMGLYDRMTASNGPVLFDDLLPDDVPGSVLVDDVLPGGRSAWFWAVVAVAVGLVLAVVAVVVASLI